MVIPTPTGRRRTRDGRARRHPRGQGAQQGVDLLRRGEVLSHVGVEDHDATARPNATGNAVRSALPIVEAILRQLVETGTVISYERVVGACRSSES